MLIENQHKKEYEGSPVGKSTPELYKLGMAIAENDDCAVLS